MNIPATTCVVLAAGMSTRLRPQTDELPKCLLKVGGKSILERTVESLLSTEITRIAFVVGFQAGKIRSHLREKFPQSKFRFILNPNFSATNNAYSLLLTRYFFEEPRDKRGVKDQLLMLDADILFHRSLLALMRDAAGENKVAVRTQGEHDEEEVRVGIDDSGNVAVIGKAVRWEGACGESIGVELFSNEAAMLLFDILEHRIKGGNGRTEYYETTIQEMLDRGTKIKAIDVGDLPVVEVDSPSDLDRAERDVVPKIDEMSNV